MRRIQDTNLGPNNTFISRNPGTNTPGTRVRREYMNDTQEEVARGIESTGQAVDTTVYGTGDGNRDQMQQWIAHYAAGAIEYEDDNGTAAVYLITQPNLGIRKRKSPAALFVGMQVIFTPTITNTITPILTITEVGSPTQIQFNKKNLPANFFTIGQKVKLEYDGVNWQIIPFQNQSDYTKLKEGRKNLLRNGNFYKPCWTRGLVFPIPPIPPDPAEQLPLNIPFLSQQYGPDGWIVGKTGGPASNLFIRHGTILDQGQAVDIAIIDSNHNADDDVLIRQVCMSKIGQKIVTITIRAFLAGTTDREVNITIDTVDRDRVVFTNPLTLQPIGNLIAGQATTLSHTITLPPDAVSDDRFFMFTFVFEGIDYSSDNMSLIALQVEEGPIFTSFDRVEPMTEKIRCLAYDEGVKVSQRLMGLTPAASSDHLTSVKIFPKEDVPAVFRKDNHLTSAEVGTIVSFQSNTEFVINKPDTETATSIIGGRYLVTSAI